MSPQALEPISLDDLMGEDGCPDMQKLAGMLRDAMIARVDAWAARMATMQAGMGPMAPILSEYDMVPMLGKQVAVIAPTGHVMDTGTFSGLDIWGRAVVITPAGEQNYPSEAVSLRQI